MKTQCYTTIISLCVIIITTSVESLTMEQCHQSQYAHLTSCQLALHNPELLKTLSSQYIQSGTSTSLVSARIQPLNQPQMLTTSFSSNDVAAETTPRCSSWFIARGFLLYAREWRTGDLYEIFYDPNIFGSQKYSVMCRNFELAQASCSNVFIVSELPVFLRTETSISVTKKIMQYSIDCVVRQH